jgi:hypothetical protein
LCGDWNINFIQESAKLNEVKNVLLVYNSINTVMTPTRITENNKSLLDVIIINKENHINPATLLDLGFSDHQVQILCIPVENPKSALVKVRKRQFTEKSIEEFRYLLLKESWQVVPLNSEVNSKFNAFMDTIVYYFNIAFPLKSYYVREPNRNRWITQGLKISSKRM